MEIEFSKDAIRFDKELNALDKLAVDFVSVLEKHGIKYVIVSGYVSILFGRSRGSEDIDVLVEPLSDSGFAEVAEDLFKDFDCINAAETGEIYEKYLSQGIGTRFARKGAVMPNIEMKIVKADLEKWALKNRLKVVLNGHIIFISCLELQIAFKLYLGRLGNEKDIEDAKYLYALFRKNLDRKLLEEFNRNLKVSGVFNKYLGPL